MAIIQFWWNMNVVSERYLVQLESDKIAIFGQKLLTNRSIGVEE